MNTLGMIAAFSAFLGIWLGHVAVRNLEFLSPSLSLPVMVFSGLGLASETFSLFIVHRPVSIVLGILGITFLWDALEFTRQERRVRKGHARANPHNPRHADILARYPAATTVDPLKERRP